MSSAIIERAGKLEKTLFQLKNKLATFARNVETYYFSESQTPAVVVAYTPANIAAAGVDWQGLAYFPKEEINIGGGRK